MENNPEVTVSMVVDLVRLLGPDIIRRFLKNEF